MATDITAVDINSNKKTFAITLKSTKFVNILTTYMHTPGFKYCFCADVCMCVCVCVCVSVPEAIYDQWCDMELIRLVKHVLPLLYGNCSHYR